jgi:hypothetical protein
MDRFGDLIPPGNYRFQGRAIPPGFVMGEPDAQQLPPLPPGSCLMVRCKAHQGLPPLPPGYRLLTDAEVGIEDGPEKKFTIASMLRWSPFRCLLDPRPQTVHGRNRLAVLVAHISR